MTFSIAARCAATGMLGVAVSSSSPAVGARCAFARAGVGAAATQNITDPSLGTRILGLIAAGHPASEAMEMVTRSSANIEYRQLTAVDGNGVTASFSGAKTLGTHASAKGADVVCAGNLLATPEVPTAMVAAFEGSDAHFGERLLAAMAAAIEAGGEEGPVHSAGIVLVDAVAWPVVDLRVDWHDTDPIGALRALWDRYRPQMDDYVTRALNPSKAPAYGVPGDR